MDQSHLRNPFQIVCGVDLHTGRMTTTSMQMVWKHNVQVADANAWINYSERQNSELNCTVRAVLSMSFCMIWFMMTSTRGTQTHTDSVETCTYSHRHTHTHTHIHTHWVSAWPPGHFLWLWCQMDVPRSPWPSGCHGQQGPHLAGRCWCRLSRGGRLSLAVGRVATVPRCHFQTALGWMPVRKRQ